MLRFGRNNNCDAAHGQLLLVGRFFSNRFDVTVCAKNEGTTCAHILCICHVHSAHHTGRTVLENQHAHSQNRRTHRFDVTHALWYVGRSGTTETIPEEDFGEREGVGGAQEELPLHSCVTQEEARADLARQFLLSAIDDEEYRENTADLYRQFLKWKMHRGSALRKAAFHAWRLLVPRRA